ncbi:proepiregulin-like [Polypterus senegalus]|uniref:proepiregulin-like n=1 Tax=Polypterus senegalus TaxID=55291 RepID=UPI001965D17A|nr:proepiregulin-like [Polypterus senegalus]
MISHRAFAFLLLLGVHMLKSVQGTTPSPSCIPGQECLPTGSSFTSFSAIKPRAEEVRIEKCGPEMEKYCFNGDCMFFPDIREHHCKCDAGFTGIRCIHSELVFMPMSKEHLILTVTCTLLLLLAFAVAIYLTYKWCKKNKCPPQQKKYQEVQLA